MPMSSIEAAKRGKAASGAPASKPTVGAPKPKKAPKKPSKKK